LLAVLSRRAPCKRVVARPMMSGFRRADSPGPDHGPVTERGLSVPDEIVGRGTELAAVERFVERARIALSGLVLEGDAGIGKTTIWEAAVYQARTAGFTVLTTGPARS